MMNIVQSAMKIKRFVIVTVLHAHGGDYDKRSAAIAEPLVVRLRCAARLQYRVSTRVIIAMRAYRSILCASLREPTTRCCSPDSLRRRARIVVISQNVHSWCSTDDTFFSTTLRPYSGPTILSLTRS